MCFAGLYDTVSTYGMGVRKDDDDNVAELSLNAVFHAEETFHLTAADEHRYHFSLTSTRSAGKRGREICLPVAHSDIGGGYREEEDENKIILGTTGLVDGILLQGSDATLPEIENDKAQLVAAGWFKESPNEQENEIFIENHDHYYFPPDGTQPIRIEKRLLAIKRRGVRNAYSKIPLNLMVE